MSALSRYLSASGLLVSSAIPVSRVLSRCYGAQAGRRFRAGMTVTSVMQQAMVGMALWGSGKRSSQSSPHRLSLVDVMTLSRGSAAAILVGLMTSNVRDRYGLAGRMGWIAVLYGAIVCDWLDGPVARRFGTSPVGAQLDLEMDSWLTLCTAGSAVFWGELPAHTAAAPLLRYAALLAAVRDTLYADVYRDEPRWVRHIGIMQMLLYIAALAPFGGRATRFAVRVVAPVQTPLQLAGLAELQRRRASRR